MNCLRANSNTRKQCEGEYASKTNIHSEVIARIQYINGDYRNISHEFFLKAWSIAPHQAKHAIHTEQSIKKKFMAAAVGHCKEFNYTNYVQNGNTSFAATLWCGGMLALRTNKLKNTLSRIPRIQMDSRLPCMPIHVIHQWWKVSHKIVEILDKIRHVMFQKRPLWLVYGWQSYQIVFTSKYMFAEASFS